MPTSAEHQNANAIDVFVAANPGAQRVGFMAAAKLIVGEPFPWGIIPDAFIVDEGAETVTALEVEHGHPLDANKMQAYCRLYLWLDNMGWDLRLRVVRTSTGDTRDIGLFEQVNRQINKRLAAKRARPA